MLAIDPNLFTRLMLLPDAARSDLLEFIGATPVADAQLAAMIEGLSKHPEAPRKSPLRGRN